MKFEIAYCRPCGYEERAEDLAGELRERFGAEVAVEEGKFGQFDVWLEGELVASKGRFLKRVLTHGPPPHSQVIDAIERAVAVREADACEIPER
jgi:selT/selW/selH-like putative selenoprotein